MKFNVHKIVYILFFISSLFIISCSPDKEEAISPTTDERDKYVARWLVSENSALAGTSSHTVNITKSTSNTSEITIDNFSGLSASVRASVNNNNITIPYQQVGTIGFTKGSGTLNGTTSINLTYTTSISTSRDSCTAVYTKQ